MAVYEVHYVDFYIHDASMVFGGEVSSYWEAFVSFFDVIEMLNKSIFEPSFCLSYILFATCFTCYAIYDVAAVAGNIEFACVCSSGSRTLDSATFI